jgi:hypothetical protein
MARDMDEYKRLFREAHVEDQQKLLGLHVVIYAIVNAVWVIINLVAVPSRLRWFMLYPIIGWGLLIFVHWWFYVRNAYGLCRIREQKIAARMGMR